MSHTRVIRGPLTAIGHFYSTSPYAGEGKQDAYHKTAYNIFFHGSLTPQMK
jgi:hypothetical protein